MRTSTAGFGMAIGVAAVAGSVVAGQAPRPGTPPPAAIRITSLTPKSVVAGAAFAVAVQLPDDFKQPLTLVVHRVGLNFEQYRSGPLRDGDDQDAAPEPGVIIHRVATNAKWTSAQSSLTPVTDKYMVSIEDPIVLQVDQVLTVLKTAIVDLGTVRGWVANAEKVIEEFKALSSGSGIAAGADGWHVYDFHATDAIVADPQGATYVLAGDSPQDRVYLRRPGLFLGANAASASWSSSSSVLALVRAFQRRQLQEEVESIEGVVASLPPDVRSTVAPEVNRMKDAAGRAGLF